MPLAFFMLFFERRKIMYYLTCTEDSIGYYSLEVRRLEEIKTIEYCPYDFTEDRFYTFEIGKFTKGRKYYKIGEVTVLLKNCKCVKASVNLSL